MIKKSDFKPAWWLSHPDLQTLWPNLFRPKIKLPTQRERFELPDGDFLDLDWIGEEGPIVFILHGLTGSIQSSYAWILKAIAEHGWRGVFIHFRGCSGEPNRLPRSYHAGDTQDIALIISTIRRRFPSVPLAAVGYSLGGNVLLKWLGETQEENPLMAAVAVSVPFELHVAAQRVSAGFSQIYQKVMLRDLKKSLQKKLKFVELPFEEELLSQLHNCFDFDSKITAPLHGFKDANDYYFHSSCRRFLKSIKKPTLILHAKDDPLLTPNLSLSEDELSPHITLELSDGGGHLGFISGNLPFWPKYWLEEKIPNYLQEIFSVPSTPSHNFITHLIYKLFGKNGRTKTSA